MNQSTLNERDIQRTKTLTEILWTDGTTNFNISMSRCLTMSDKAGIYTAKSGNLPNATIQDIVADLQARKGSEAANRAEYASRVEENAQLTIDAANQLLQSGVADYTPTTATTGAMINSNTHDEFRHLLAPLSEAVAIILRASLLAEISVAFFAGLAGRAIRTIPDSAVAVFAITSYALHIAIGIHHFALHRPMNFISATVLNVFLSWVRNAVRVFAGEFLPRGEPGFLPSVWIHEALSAKGNQTRPRRLGEGIVWPLLQEVVRNASEQLGYVEQPQGRFVAASGVEGGGTC